VRTRTPTRSRDCSENCITSGENNAFQPYIRAQSKQKDRDNDLAPRRIILLVEDEPFVREATCGILESAGFDVLPAADLPQALQAYERYQRKDSPAKIDLVMTDMMLPSGTG
jgi:PleD family two-component response regulator